MQKNWLISSWNQTQNLREWAHRNCCTAWPMAQDLHSLQGNKVTKFNMPFVDQYHFNTIKGDSATIAVGRQAGMQERWKFQPHNCAHTRSNLRLTKQRELVNRWRSCSVAHFDDGILRICRLTEFLGAQQRIAGKEKQSDESGEDDRCKRQRRLNWTTDRCF